MLNNEVQIVLWLYCIACMKCFSFFLLIAHIPHKSKSNSLKLKHCYLEKKLGICIEIKCDEKQCNRLNFEAVLKLFFYKL